MQEASYDYVDHLKVDEVDKDTSKSKEVKSLLLPKHHDFKQTYCCFCGDTSTDPVDDDRSPPSSPWKSGSGHDSRDRHRMHSERRCPIREKGSYARLKSFQKVRQRLNDSAGGW